MRKTIFLSFLLIGIISCQPLGSFSVNPSDKLSVESLPNASNNVSLTISNSNAGKAFSLTESTITGTDASLFTFTKEDNSAATPFSVSVGSTTRFLLKFSPTSLGVKSAVLTLSFDSHPSIVIPIRGLCKAGEGGDNEPSLQYIFDTLLFKQNVGDNDPTSASYNDDRSTWKLFPRGDTEIVSRYFVAADPLKNVTIVPIACYGPNKTPGQFTTATSELSVCDAKFQAGSSGCKSLLQIGEAQGQTLNPSYSGVNYFTPAANQPFSFYSRWPAFSDRNDGNVYGDDQFNTFTNALPHHVRVYPYSDQQGNQIPDTYVLTWEEYTEAVDFQDLIIVVSNIRPSGSPLKIENNATPNVGGIPLFGFENLAVIFPNTTSATLLLRNTGPIAVEITDLTITNAVFKLTDAFPITVPANSAKNLTFTYSPTGNQLASSTVQLAIEGNSPSPISLYAISGNSFTAPDLVGSWGLSINEQVSSSSWTVADTSKPGYAYLLGSLSSSNGLSTLQIASTDIRGSGTFQGKNTGFGITIVDASGTTNSSSLQFYPVRNKRTSKLALNSWVVASGSSVWYVTNVQPVSSNSPFGAFSGPFYLDFSAAIPRTLLDSNGNSIGFTSYRSGFLPSLAQVSYSSKSLTLTSSTSTNAPQVSFYGKAMPVTVRVEISSLSNFGSGEQSFGVFIGTTNVENSVKIVVTWTSSTSASVGVSVGNNAPSSSQTVALPLTSLVLELTVNPLTKQASGSFKDGSNTFQSISPVDVGNINLFDSISHAGVFASGPSFTVTLTSFNLFAASHSSQVVQSPLDYYGGSASTLIPSSSDGGNQQNTSQDGPGDDQTTLRPPTNTLSPSSPTGGSSLVFVSWGIIALLASISVQL
eukprot:TRINITY_DN11330_c0_g1_i1.p1 TRINITY_DN11330_c0_g1~~TRINITY_DN11330_c0_g1_i1.p1  ORF type:complete len:869 (+),score=202.41 TRINITY_DN11330_c0_g1_i1:103-2709(+)